MSTDNNKDPLLPAKGMTLAERMQILELQFDAEFRKHYTVVHSINDKNQELVYKRPTVFQADSAEELDTMLDAYYRAGGKRGRGNKRKQRLYSDLTNYFFKLQKQGIKLPRWNLSKKACSSELLKILIEHEYVAEGIEEDTLMLSSSSGNDLRKKLHHRMEGIFNQIADAVEKKPP